MGRVLVSYRALVRRGCVGDEPPEENSTGAVPLLAAYRSRFVKRAMLPVLPMSIAAMTGPTP